MPDYNHLKTPIAESRYILAAHYLRHCDRIVEIGGQKLYTHMKAMPSWNIDPLGHTGIVGTVNKISAPAKDFNFNHILANNDPHIGLALLGLEIYDDEYGDGVGLDTINHIGSHIQKFKTIIIEFVSTNSIAIIQATLLLHYAQEAGMDQRMIMKNTWELDSKYLEPNDSFSKERTFLVIS